MIRCNFSTMTEFVLQGLTDQPELKLPLLLLFLVVYGITVDSKLQTPMYFFLGNLSLIDLVYSSVVTPKLLGNFIWEQNVISYSGCMTQLFFYCTFAIAESYMLAAMAYDRYAAICNPLLYSLTMSQKACSVLITGVYIMASLGVVAHTSSMIRLSFHGENVIHHYFCDIIPLLQLSCSSIYFNELLVTLIGGFNVLATTGPIAISYTFILTNILRIPSSESRSKAFSTCSSHLTAVAVFYRSIMFMYFKPTSSHSRVQEKVASVFYTTVIPMLNPLIYSLRNKDVKYVLSKVMRKRCGLPQS